MSVLTLHGRVGVVAHALVDPAVVRDYDHLTLVASEDTCAVLRRRGLPHILPLKFDQWYRKDGVRVYLLKSNFAAGACMALCGNDGILYTMNILYTRMWWAKRTLASILKASKKVRVREVRLDMAYAKYNIPYAYDQLPKDVAAVGESSGGRVALLDPELRYQHLYALLKFRASPGIRDDPRYVSESYLDPKSERLVVQRANQVPAGYVAFRIDDACFLLCKRSSTLPYRGRDGMWRVFYPRHTLGPGVDQMRAYLASHFPEARVVLLTPSLGGSKAAE